MYSKEILLEMLSSKKASTRYEACEWIRTSQVSSPEIVSALEKATHDKDSEVAARAMLALQADGHHHMAIKMGMIEPDKEEVEAIQPDELTKHIQPSLLENQDQSTHIPSLTDSGIDERQDNQIDGFDESVVHASTESHPPNRKETITRALRLILILGAIAIVILVLFNKFGQQNPDSAKAYFNRGLSYYDKGNQDQAISNYDKAIQLDPNFALAYYQRGVAYQKKGDFDRAISDYNKGIQLDPDNANAYNNRGGVYLSISDFDRAISDFDQAIKLDPNNTYAYFNRGGAYLSIGDFDRAISDFDQAIKLNPKDADTYNSRGYAYLNNGDVDHALSDFDKAIQLDSNLDNAYSNRGVAYLEKGDFDKSITDFDKAIQLNPNFPNAYYVRGLAYSMNGSTTEAIADFKKTLDLCGSNTQLCEAAQEKLQELGEQ